MEKTMKLRFVFLAAVIAGTVFADDFTIPETLYPIPAKRSFDPEVIAKAQPYPCPLENSST